MIRPLRQRVFIIFAADKKEQTHKQTPRNPKGLI